MGLPKDFDTKIPVTIGLIIWVAIVSFSLGALYTKVLDSDRRLDDEIGGLRADWDRDRADQNRRIERLEKIVLENGQ